MLLIVNAPDVAAVAKALSHWELGEYISASLVAVACMGEYLADFTTVFTKGIPERKERLAKCSTLLLVAALALELMCLVRTNQLSGMAIGSLGDKAQKADDKARKAIGDSSAAMTHAEQALTKAEQADVWAGNALLLARNAAKETGRLTAKLADRRLTDAQVAAIATGLEPFAEQEFDVTTYWESREPLAIANRIFEALNRAHWKYLPPKSRAFIPGELGGVFVYRHPDADERTKKAADALVAALNNHGITAQLREQNPTNNPKHNKISLIVGRKP